MNAFVAAGAGFLLAVLWFDLMFDVQVLRGDAVDRPGDALASIAAYYARVTTGARPMNQLIGLVMLATLSAIVVQIARGDDPQWLGWSSLALAGGAILIAALHTFPSAVRLGARGGTVREQLELAQSIARDHLLCLGAIVVLLAIQVGFG